MIALSTQRSEMAYAVKSDKLFKDFDSQMDAVKNVLLENIITAKSTLQYDLSIINAKIDVATFHFKTCSFKNNENPTSFSIFTFFFNPLKNLLCNIFIQIKYNNNLVCIL